MEEVKKKPKKRHIIEMTDAEHIELKKRAADLGISVRGWLMGAIQLRIEAEKQAKIVSKIV